MPVAHIITRTGVALSIAGHIAFVLWVLWFSQTRIFDSAEPEIVNVEIVPQNEAPPPPTPETQADQAEAKPPPQPPPPPPTKPSDQADAKPPSAPASPNQRAQPEKPAPPQPMPTPQQQQPQLSEIQSDLLKRYGVVSDSQISGLNAATEGAQIPQSVVAQFRAHLKSCAKLPASISAEDKVTIKLRVGFTPAGRLTTEPALIEASASAKGPLLMQSAKSALVACQPYTMLPADQYDEWKVLDLTFTPADFQGG